LADDTGGDNPGQEGVRASQHPVDLLIRDLVQTRRSVTDDEIGRIIDRMADVPFDERIVAVRLRFRGLTYQEQTLGDRERAVFLHLIQRVVVDEQWAVVESYLVIKQTISIASLSRRMFNGSISTNRSPTN